MIRYVPQARRLLQMICALPLIAAGAAAGQTAPADSVTVRGTSASRPNILFVFSDDHAAHAISAYGSKINQTPHIDRLAKEGMLFRNCFVENSICVPSRATILTGKFSHKHGALNIGDRLEQSQGTFPQLLREAGYQTALIGKWHLRDDPVGFDYWNILIGQGPYYNPPMIKNGQRSRYTGYTTEIITDHTLNWLKNERDPDKPFMLMYQHKAPHRNWEPGPDHLNLFDGEAIPEPETLLDDWADNASAARLQEMTIAEHMYPSDLMLQPPRNYTEEQLAAWHAAFDDENEAYQQADPQGVERTKWRYQRYIKNYLRAVQSVDDNLGRVLAYLDETGLADNTIVIYSSDQGFFLGDHGWYDKRFMYEECLRMPLIVRWPGVTEPGSESEHLVQNIDFAQSFLDMAQANPKPEQVEQMQGQSIVPLLKGEDPPDWRDAIYYHYYDFPAVHQVRRHYGVRDDRYKLISFYDQDEWELYDLEKDPEELHNVYSDPAYAEVVETMKQKLKQLQQQYGDTDPDASNAQIHLRVFRELAKGMRPQRVVDLANPQQAKDLPEVDPTARELLVGATVTPTAGDGIIVSQGGEQTGYALYLKQGVPQFVVREEGEIFTVTGPEPLAMDQPTHVAGRLTVDDELTLLINGQPIATAPGKILSRRPFDPLIVGDDTNSPVGEYETPMPFQGQLRNLRIYLGVPPDEEIDQWTADHE